MDHGASACSTNLLKFPQNHSAYRSLQLSLWVFLLRPPPLGPCRFQWPNPVEKTRRHGPIRNEGSGYGLVTASASYRHLG